VAVGLASLPSDPSVRPALYRGAAAALLGGLAVIGVAGTRDYLEWNRARWELLDELADEGISPKRIDGGFEFQGYYNYVRRSRTLKKGGPGRWVEDDEFLVSYSADLPGYRVIATREYVTLLPPGRHRVFSLRRDTVDAGDPANAPGPG